MSSDVMERLKQIVCERLDVKAEDVTPQAHLIEDLGADSLDVVDLAMAIEETFGIEVKDHDYANLTSLADAAVHIEHLLQKRDQPQLEGVATA